MADCRRGSSPGRATLKEAKLFWRANDVSYLSFSSSRLLRWFSGLIQGRQERNECVLKCEMCLDDLVSLFRDGPTTQSMVDCVDQCPDPGMSGFCGRKSISNGIQDCVDIHAVE